MAGRVLILGGTREGYALSARLQEAGIDAISSLAGRTTSPELPDGAVRIGGFGGRDGLADYLRTEQIGAVVDATHPFATQITGNAIEACAQRQVPYLRLERAAWRPQTGDRWIEFPSLDAALQDVGQGFERVFAVVGKLEIVDLGSVPSVAFVARSVEPPVDLPDNVTWVQGRGPFSLAAELALFGSHRIQALVCRASGGCGGYAKIKAARRLGLPVLMIRRPTAPVAETVETVDETLQWLDQLLRRRTCV